MTEQTKRILFGLLLIFEISDTRALDNLKIESDLGELAGAYYGSCMALRYLKQTYCPKIAISSPKQCESNTLNVLPIKLQKEFSNLLQDTFTSNGLAEINHSLDGGYKKVLGMTDGDKDKACSTYGASLLTLHYQKLEELKRIAKYAK